jgi:hypothetical protein
MLSSVLTIKKYLIFVSDIKLSPSFAHCDTSISTTVVSAAVLKISDAVDR